MLKRYKYILSVILITIMVSLLTACGGSENIVKKADLTIISGSENKTLEPIIKEFEKINNVSIDMKYMGSVDIKLQLQEKNIPCDAVWPANSLWISMGDVNHVVKYQKSIMTSPVVFGIRKSLAEKLGFTNRKVSVKDIQKAILDKKLSFMMTSATQSNSGASAYLGFLYAILGNPETISSGDLKSPKLKTQITQLLSGINRSSGSSDWLKDLFLKGKYDAMVNYESLIIETNQQLIKQGKEPLYAVYPYDGLVIADSPLGYINKGDSKKEDIYKKLQDYLLSEKIQNKILDLGRRTGFGGVVTNADPKVFNTDWGIDTNKVLSPIKLPSSDVIEESLNLYQTQFKKPSYTIFCLDFSGSMSGNGESQVKTAMKTILDQDTAKKYMLQSTAQDVITVIPFSDNIFNVLSVKGNDKNKLERLNNQISELHANGGTDIYSPAIRGLSEVAKINLDNYIPSVIIMTDGKSNVGKTFKDLESIYKNLGKDIPIFSIIFGDASEDQLNEITNLTRGSVFDGKTDLINAFKKVRGYN